MGSLLFHLLNKPWEWRAVCTEYWRRRDAQWELVEYWRQMRVHTCRACLREMRKPTVTRICSDCWLLMSVPESDLTAREVIRRRRVMGWRECVDAR